MTSIDDVSGYHRGIWIVLFGDPEVFWGDFGGDYAMQLQEAGNRLKYGGGARVGRVFYPTHRIHSLVFHEGF